MYEALVARMRYHIQKANFMGLKEAESTLLLIEAADAIEELQGKYFLMTKTAEWLAEKVPKWIPVTERLPETPGEYMVAYHPCYWDRVHDEIKVGLDSFRGKTSWAKKKYQRVTHWMPLPQPPKEE